MSPDEPDNRFLECALAGRVDYLVTGNARDFPGPEYQGARIVNPAEFAGILIG
jgi:predicted nucleic acid-binding protein